MLLLLILLPSLALLILTRMRGLRPQWLGVAVAVAALLQALVVALYMALLERPLTP
jgi:hypothetical protein